MLNYITRGRWRPLLLKNRGTAFYLPREEVKKEKHGKTKWKIVFDVSSHETNVPSLNYVLEMGPKLFPEIVAILRFILHPTAIISYVTQAFLQLVLDERDRDLPNSSGTNSSGIVEDTTVRLMKLCAASPVYYLVSRLTHCYCMQHYGNTLIYTRSHYSRLRYL
jgi:hypothetical protein